MIPRIIHFCWFGDAPMPDAHRKFVEGWRARMPEFEFVFWNEENAPMEIPYLESARAGRRWVNLANFIRLYSVYHQGGIYLDTDVEAVRSFEPLLTRSSCFFGRQIEASQADENDVNNAVFGAEQGHPFIGKQLDAIQALYDGLETEYLSGPHLTTFLLRSNGLLDDETRRRELGIALYPRTYFFPYSWLEAFDPSCVSEDTYAIHHWAGLWGEGSPEKSRLAAIARLPGMGWLTRFAGESS